jgi:hypothetical protein
MQKNAQINASSYENSVFSHDLAKYFWKSSKVLMAGIIIGAFDAWQVNNLRIGYYGTEAAVLYQGSILVAAGAASLICLYDKSWSRRRNALNILVAIPVATISDNVSLDLQLMKPYVILLPSSGFEWRLQVFNHTFLYPLASWVDLQTFAPGLIDGYLAAIAIAALYIVTQLYWNRISFDSFAHALQASRMLITNHFPFRR